MSLDATFRWCHMLLCCFGVNNMKTLIHPALYQRFRLLVMGV